MDNAGPRSKPSRRRSTNRAACRRASFALAWWVVACAPATVRAQPAPPEAIAKARLDRMRNDPELVHDAAAIEALARDAESFPPGTVRDQARMFVAEAWLGRLQRPDDAILELRRVAHDPGADALTARLAEREIVDALAAAGHLVEAAAEAHAQADLLDPLFVRRVSKLLFRRWIRGAAIAVLGTFGTLAAAALAKAQRRGALGHARVALRVLAPMAVLFAAFVAVGGGLLASSYESGNAYPFLLLGGALLPLVLVARAWSAVGSERPLARAARVVLCGVGVFATAFLLLDMVSPEYLEGFGL
jgi:hypothetical protein